MMAKEEFNEPWLYRVFVREGAPIMAVLVGRAAQYEKEILLTDAQYEAFLTDRNAARSYAEAVSKGDVQS